MVSSFRGKRDSQMRFPMNEIIALLGLVRNNVFGFLLHSVHKALRSVKAGIPALLVTVIDISAALLRVNRPSGQHETLHDLGDLAGS